MRSFFAGGIFSNRSDCSTDAVVVKREPTRRGKFLWQMCFSSAFVFLLLAFFLFLAGDRVSATRPIGTRNEELNDGRRLSFSPGLTVVSYQRYFDAHNCTTAILSGRGFTPPTGFTALTASLYASATSPYNNYGLVDPHSVQISFQGNFDAKVSICYPASFGHINSLPALELYAIDDSTGKKFPSVTAPLSFVVGPPPHIAVRATSVKLFGDCVTVRIFGWGFIPSDFSANYTNIIALADSHPFTIYPVAPSSVSVMVKGNIAIAASVCRLSHGQVFDVFVLDDSTRIHSNSIAIHVV